jgi:hypothetical protein
MNVTKTRTTKAGAVFVEDWKIPPAFTGTSTLCTAVPVHAQIGLQVVDDPKIFRQSAHEGGKVVSPKHRPPPTPKKVIYG